MAATRHAALHDNPAAAISQPMHGDEHELPP
jgi:hypothetical protein